MTNMIKAFLITLILLLSLPASANPPELRLVNISGAEEPLSKHIGKGQWVVVNIWSPTCSACVIELPRIKQFIARNPEIPMLGVTLDFPSFEYGKMDILRNIVKRTPLDYPLFLADIEQASKLIGRRLTGIPSIAIFHPDGRALVTWPGVVEIDEIEKFITNYKKEDDDPLSSSFK